ncbi:MAG: NAD(P)H-dependent oxidoreductase [Anaerolineales bacterium]|nr:NAD(P)H-dependent oxidoreductase [Anaerolineales bacterium]
MQISLILAHPNPGSFNYAIARAAGQELGRLGHSVDFHDLYAEHFDPLLPAGEIQKSAPLPPEIETHCREISQADGIVIVHPDWWGQPPAVLKGWIDRVLRPGAAYEFLEGDQGEGIPAGLLKAEAAAVFNTSNTPARREADVFGDPLERIWRSCIFDFCGVKQFRRRMFGVVVTSTPQQREAWLDEVRAMAAETFPADRLLSRPLDRSSAIIPSD